MSTFDDAFALVIGVEGGYVNDPRDSGGETKYGISKRSYPTLDIPNLTLAEAKVIYQRDYWSKVGADLLPPAAAIVLFDYAVNSGPGSKIEMMQTVLGMRADGEIGPETLAAIGKMGGPKLAVQITALRMVTLASLPKWSIYALGWARRMATILAAAIEHETALPAVTTYISPMPPVEQIKQAMREVFDERKAA